MTDLYTKTVLTVIAAALCAIAARDISPPEAVAQGAVCGAYSSPCYIEVKSGELEVDARITNWPR